MIDRESENLLTLPQAAQTLPGRKAGKAASSQTLWRWSKVGCKGIVLETIAIGGTAFTSLEALDRFFEAIEAARGKKRPPRETSRRRRLREDAMEAKAIAMIRGLA